MSGILHAIGKVFHAVAHGIGHIFHEIANHWQEVVIAAIAIYTGGLALGAWGAMGGTAAAAGSGVAATETGTALASTAAAGTGAVATTAVGGVATVGGAETLGLGAGLSTNAIIAGTAATIPGTLAASAGASALGTSLAAIGTTSTPFTSMLASAATSGSQNAISGFISHAWSATKTVATNVKTEVGKFLFGGSAQTQFSHMMLLKTGVDALSGYMTAHPPPPRNFYGSGPGGGHAMGFHLTDGGFGIAIGGSTPPPTGIPNKLIPGNTSYTPPTPPTVPGISNPTVGVPSQVSSGVPPHPVQNTGHSLGGLIPQGAVNFMDQAASGHPAQGGVMNFGKLP